MDYLRKINKIIPILGLQKHFDVVLECRRWVLLIDFESTYLRYAWDGYYIPHTAPL